MTEIDRRITEPHYNAPFLAWYEGIFESVYIAIHPFFKIEGITPDKAPRPNIFISREDVTEETLKLAVVDKISNEYSDQFPVDLKTLQKMEKNIGALISWEEIRLSCGFNSIAQVNAALLTIIMAIRNDGRQVDADHLQAYCSANRIFLPTEDTFPPIVQDTICLLLKKLGHDNVFIGDEFNDTVIEKSISDLEIETPWFCSEPVGFSPNKIYPGDNSFPMIVPFDAFYTIICGDRDVLESAGIEKLLEGFWCTGETLPTWWQEA
jgi:hypothetical protein